MDVLGKRRVTRTKFQWSHAPWSVTTLVRRESCVGRIGNTVI